MVAGIFRLIAFALLFAWIIVGVGTAPVEGQTCPGITSPLNPMLSSLQQLTISTSAVGLAVPRGAKMAVVSVELSPIRYRDDFVDPADTTGILVQPGSALILCGQAIERFRAIRQSGSDALLHILFYGG